MNPHDDNPNEPQDESQIASVLKTTETDAPPADPAVLARLRTQSTDVFTAASSPPSRPAAFWRWPRWLAAAAVLLAGITLFFVIGTPSSSLALGTILDDFERADSVHVRFRHGDAGGFTELWHTGAPNQSRWDTLDGHYHIAVGDKFWIVNESASEARRAAPPQFVNQPLHHFFDSIGVSPRDPVIRAARPSGRKRVEGADVFVFHVSVKDRNGESVELVFHVDAQSRRLRFIGTEDKFLGNHTFVVLAIDQPIDAEKFVIADTLTEDGRIGKVTDVQGIVSIKPALHERWTPVRPGMVLRPGDWLRTDARGANAAALRLVKNTGVILGPKTLVELISPKQIRLIEGEIEITPSAGATIELLGAGNDKVLVKARQLYRIHDMWNPPPTHNPKAKTQDTPMLVQGKEDPSWLRGFKGVTGNETLGSLVALVDGRNVPLTVGYHKVQVDIRDQIARTVIEESFVNHTKTELEGVFYFPLPQDASISGFGMWVGDNLVEADVVEKQRAREIYETILRERRDPGLLEWAGGNIFKARVFPIPAGGEKRIKISYTQVLPLKGSRYRYSYALQSELLQQHPLRELSIDVKVNSVVPLNSVTSPTHPTRDECTTYSAHVEFAAQQYTPTRDFEVVVQTAGRQDSVVMIPHRRGDDGYFMLQLTPPGADGNWDRPLLPNGDPLHLLILADTSASIDAGQRTTQAVFIGSLLSSLTPKDTFNLAACDVSTDWAFTKAVSADEKKVYAAREFLAKRSSLGWTNLDAAFAAALKQSGPTTHVIYVGDGIPTTGDADPVAFAKRLRRTWDGFQIRPTFHAVSLGSSYESGVLKAIASLGGGSMRRITGEQGPTLIARELLGEIAQPALRDIKVEFKGFKVARVYPDSLANVPAGSQQILLGRYLPEGKDQSGEVIVTGTQGGKPVRFSTRASLKDAEQGISFIPRLWARMHLDSLLEQGSSEAIKDEIIALSEEFHIITPYTSLLVLETDADRERFKVKRRFQMRDGERFFADGRDNAVFDLAQKQMKKAAAWRTALRRSVMNELVRLGREPRMFQPRSPRGYKDIYSLGRGPYPVGDLGFPDLDGATGGFGYEMKLGLATELGVTDEPEMLLRQLREEDHNERFDRQTDLAEKLEAAEPAFGIDEMQRNEPALLALRAPFIAQTDGLYLDDPMNFSVKDSTPRQGWAYFQGRRRPHYGHWLNTLFPPLSAAPGKPKEPKSTWPADARALARSLLRTDTLAKMTDGIEIVRKTETFDTRWGELSARADRLELISAKSWVTRSSSDNGQTLISWCDPREIGVYSLAFQLGRVRASTPLDTQPPLELSDYSLASLERTYADHTPTLQPLGKDRTLLILKRPIYPHHETRILIDTARHVILSIESRHKDKVTTATTFADFVEVAGSWWAQRVESTSEGKRYSLVTQTVKARTLVEFEKQLTAELASRAPVQFLNLPMPSVAAAKKAHAAGKASFDDEFVLLMHFHASQQWERVLGHLQQAEKLAPGKPGLRWLRSALLHDSRRHDDLRQRYQADAAALAKGERPNSYFLAEYVVNQSANVLQATEMVPLLDVLQALYDKQPPHVQARKRWLQLRATYGRSDETLKLRIQIATEYPRDYSAQQEYARALAAAGDYPAAYAWLTRVLVKEAKWLYWEEDYLRSTYTSLLQQQGRNADLVAYLAAWIEQNPRGRSAHEQYLTALIKADQIEKADALALRWLKDAQVPGELTPVAAGRLDAAVRFMLGYGHDFWTNRIDEKWLTPLGQAALFFARHETQYSTTDQVLGHHQFRRSEEGQRVRKKLAGILSAEIDKLPAEQVRRFVEWVRHDDAEPAVWAKIRAQLRQRWTKEADEEVKHILGRALLSVLTNHGVPNEPLTFLRVQWQTGPTEHRTAYANELFNHLLGLPWSAEIEDEALSMFDKLSSAEESGARRYASVAALHRLTDRMLDNRIAAGTKALVHPERDTRTEWMKKQADIRKQAREGLADRLRKEAAKHPMALGQWLIAESAYLDVVHDRNLKQAAADAWELLGAAPPKKAEDGPSIERTLDHLLRQRALLVLTNLAARKGADAALLERLLKYHDQGIAIDAERWKPATSRLLIALDRAKELEQTLQRWTREDDPDHRWRIALGYLYAEQGKVAEAIREFEAVEADDELTPDAYRALADWYLIQGQRDKHDRAAGAVYKTMPEHYLSRLIAARLHPWQRGDGRLPTELDKEVLRQFAVLFDKSATPANYLGYLQQFYQASHDFRLLAGLPDAVIGHSAARVYPFVQGMDGVLSEVRDEATADEIVKRIAEVRPRAKTAVDKRALDMLEVLVERRAAELQNQPGPHVEKALAALVRTTKGEWSAGEPRLMADYLANLGKNSQAALKDEQLRQLKALHATAKPGSLDRLHIAHQHAATLHGYARVADAVDQLQTALDEYQAAHDGVMPVAANSALGSFLRYLEGAGHFTRGEKTLLAQLKRPVHAEQRIWLTERLDQLYHRALQNDGEVALGKGAMLYQALNAKLQKDLADPDQNHRHRVITLLCQVYRTAHEKKLPGIPADVKTFAFKVAPPVLKLQTNHHENDVSAIAHTVRDLVGPRDGIAFLLDRIETEPRWLRYSNQDGWSRHGHTLGDWRLEAKKGGLGDVEARLLKLVLAELRRDLDTRYAPSRTIYWSQYGHDGRFWKEKADDFARTAEAVLADRKNSGEASLYIADYFYRGLDRPKRAIEILFLAHNDKLLDEDGQATLITYLHEENRHGESIALLQPLVARRPENLDYRVRLMHAYFRTSRNAELLALLKATDAFFHENDRWGEHPLAMLAKSTLQNEQFEQSVAYSKELIPLHERTHPNRGVGNGTLAGYYADLARAYAGLKKTPEAVDAAGAAIIAWGPRRDQREAALDTMRHVVRRSPDLDGFVIHLDKQKQDSAIIRKAIGQVYHEDKQYARAIKQFELAAALQPNDADIHKLLVEAHDKAGDKEGAIRQLLQSVQLSRRDIKLFEELGKRYAEARNTSEAERAYTSIVEVLPTEAESHALLAEIRQQQNRWPDAIDHWEQVARLRALEPTGLLKLAAAQIHEKQWYAARQTLRKLDARTWPARFGNVRREANELHRQLPKAHKN